METVYLVISVNGALYTLNAYRPTGLRRQLFFGISWFASWLTIEFAWLNLVGQMALSAWFVRKGVLTTTRGRIALAVNVVSWLGLAAMVWRSFGVRHEVRAAFNDLEAPALTRRKLGVKRTRDIVYAQAGRKELKLDVYEPKVWDEPGTKRPALLQIHGGAWVFGDKRQQGLPLLKHLAAQGWVGFNANYRLSPKATFPDHLVDLKHAVAWIREHAEEYNVDPDFIVVTGGSAGGHLSTLLALTANDPEFQPGFESADTSVQACVPFYGVYDFGLDRGYYPASSVRRFFGRVVLKASPDKAPERFAQASAFTHIHAGAPPFFVVHGSLDTMAPVQMARDFVEELRATSDASVLYLELRGAQHAFEVLPSIRTNEVVRAVERFLGKLWADHTRGLAPEDVPAEELADAVGAGTDENITA